MQNADTQLKVLEILRKDCTLVEDLLTCCNSYLVKPWGLSFYLKFRFCSKKLFATQNEKPFKHLLLQFLEFFGANYSRHFKKLSQIFRSIFIYLYTFPYPHPVTQRVGGIIFCNSLPQPQQVSKHENSQPNQSTKQQQQIKE